MSFPTPERYTPLPYNVNGKLAGVGIIFKDPEFAMLRLDGIEGAYEVSWATEGGASQSLESLVDFVNAGDFTKGRIVFARPSGNSILKGDADDIINEVIHSTENVCNFRLSSKALELCWNPAWPMDLHETPTNEISLLAKRQGAVTRYLVDQCMALTALPDLRKRIDVTLDQLAKYENSLK